MPRRHTPSAPAESPRGVFIDHENRRIRSVTAKGRRVELRTFFTEEESEVVAADMWEKLDRIDPLTDAVRLPHARHLRLI